MEDLRAPVTLLNDVFGFDPPIGRHHLEWYYQANPEGEAAVGRVDADDRSGGPR